ncbi:HD domain-containing phosphohydrolase [Geomonas subterranea]|uniref:Response regulator n=1 Tax=Geomonas subterranea TaxID=2847989 RepID=A0ABX8LII4_9BACT|nr:MULTISPECIES: HD domain-containing phosphohydrolase [Geomonas]QXE90721.1 response regulator [Geomonas subterranea]QXM11197.1 response regulator [Geomonas subterranea]
MENNEAQRETVLFVDDEKSYLAYTSELFENRGLHILTASSAMEALEIVEHQSVAVVVSDNEMPGMRGIELLSRIKEVSPHTVKIMMTGSADLSTTLAAINSGEVFRFVLKPWKKAEMLRAVKDGLRRYRVLQAIKREDEFILHSLAQTIELKDACTKGHCDRVATLALRVAAKLGIPEDVQQEIRYGSWLHDCGKIGVPEAILNAERALTPEEFKIVMKHPEWGCEVVRKANLSKTVQNIVLYHHERFDGKGYPHGLAGSKIPIEAQIVATADICDALTMDRPYRKGFNREEVMWTMKGMSGSNLDPKLVQTLFFLLAEDAPTEI